MAKDPALLVYTKDFLEGTQDLSAEEFGVFTRLIFHQHQRTFLPKELKKLARLSGVSLSEFEEIWKEIHAKFTLTDTGYANKRCADEIAKRSQNGLKKSILAVYGNWIKANKHLSKEEIENIKKDFSVSEFLEISNEEKRKNSIINYLNEKVANAKRTHIANVNGDVNAIVNKDETEDTTEIENCFLECLKSFPEHLHPKSNQVKNWKETIRKLNQIEKIPFEKIVEIVQKTRANDFWSKNFLSLTKLRKPNKEGVKYIVVFNEQQIKSNGSNSNKGGATSDFRKKTAERLGYIQPN